MATKPTKAQFAKDADKLKDAADDLSKAMQLDPPIKTDCFNTDLKNKKVTVSALQIAITTLQVEIKEAAGEIEPTDVFQKATHEVLADLGVKVPQPDGAKKEKPIKKAEKEKPAKPSSPSPSIKVSAKVLDPIIFSKVSDDNKVKKVMVAYDCAEGKARSIFKAHARYREKVSPRVSTTA